jgi:hypothetical protein
MRISWDDGEKFYSQGLYNAVLYPQNSPGVPWSGMLSVTENADDAPTAMYQDGQKYLSKIVPPAFAGSISAFTYPDEFEPCIGLAAGLSAQPKEPFGFTYRDNRELHLVYNATAAPSSDQYSTITDNPSLLTFSWNFTTVPVDVTSAKPTAHLVITLDYADLNAISDLEAMLYGDDDNDSFLPDPDTVTDLFESHTTVRITDNGDGTWTASGPDSAVFLTDSTHFEINWPSAIFISADTYQIYSL